MSGHAASPFGRWPCPFRNRPLDPCYWWSVVPLPFPTNGRGHRYGRMMGNRIRIGLLLWNNGLLAVFCQLLLVVLAAILLLEPRWWICLVFQLDQGVGLWFLWEFALNVVDQFQL